MSQRRFVLLNLPLYLFVAVCGAFGGVLGDVIAPLPLFWALGSLVGVIASLFLLALIFEQP